MWSVFVIVSVLNGYKNIENIYHRRANAEVQLEEMRKDSRYDRHELYICEYRLD
jgi:hypothetical protein